MIAAMRPLALVLALLATAGRPRAAIAVDSDDIVERALELLRRQLPEDLTDDELAAVRASCSWRAPSRPCAALAGQCALPDAVRLGSNLHRACEHLNVVLPRGALALWVHAAAARVVDPAALGGSAWVITGGVAGRVLVQRLRVALRGDVRAGATSDGAFVLDGSLGLGGGFMPARTLAILVTAGLGTSGITGGRQPFALTFPIEGAASGALGRRGQLLGWVRVTLPTLAARREGTPELSAGLALGLGRNTTHLGHARSHGPLFGVEYVDAMGTQLIGVVLAWGSLSHGAGADP